MTGEWLLFEHSLHRRTQALKATAHVGNTCGDPDPCSCTQLDHWRRLSRIVRSKEPSAPFSTLIVARPGNSMWIAPVGAAASGPIGADNAIPASKLVASPTTGTNDVVHFSASTTPRVRYSPR